VLLAFLNGLLWMAIVPPWQAPDEPKHMEFIRLMRGSGPIAFETEQRAADPELQRQIVASMDAHRFWWYGHAPGYDPDAPPDGLSGLWFMGAGSALARTSPLYHWPLSRLQPDDLLAGLYVARMVSVVLGSLIVLMTGLAARELFPAEPLVRYGAPLFLALHPMFAFAHAGVNNDVLVNALSALALLVMARLFTRGGSVARLVLLGGTVAAAVAVKRIALVLVPTALLAIVLWRATRSRRPVAAAVVWTSLLGAAILLAASWWFSSGVDSLPESWRNNLGQYFFNDPGQVSRIVDYARLPEVRGVMADYVARVHHGFWGSYGWALLDYPRWLYAVVAVAGAVAAVGVARRLAARSTPGPQRAGLLVYAAAVGLTVAAAVAFFLGYLDLPYPVPPQGRYLFLVAVPVAVLLTSGWAAWLRRADGRRALLALGVAMTVLDVIVLVAVGAWFYA
jgi:hypothetical protein